MVESMEIAERWQSGVAVTIRGRAKFAGAEKFQMNAENAVDGVPSEQPSK